MFKNILDQLTRSLLARMQNRKFELIFLSVSALSFIFSLVIFTVSYNNHKLILRENQKLVEKKQENDEAVELEVQAIFVDISGGVVNPGVHELNEGARLNDVLEKAGGLSKKADETYFYRNFNLSRVIVDQEKIYVPSVAEIREGRFVDESSSSVLSAEAKPVENDTFITSGININTASSAQLEELAGVGEKTAQKIIEGRPYTSVEDLLSKKIIGESLYSKIRELVAVQ